MTFSNLAHHVALVSQLRRAGKVAGLYEGCAAVLLNGIVWRVMGGNAESPTLLGVKDALPSEIDWGTT